MTKAFCSAGRFLRTCHFPSGLVQQRRRATETSRALGCRRASVEVSGSDEGNACVRCDAFGRQPAEVLFARWLLRPPKVLVADEPTKGVDVGAKLAIYDLLHGLAAEGMAILLISSELEEIIGLSHRVLVMRGGRIIASLEGEAIDEGRVMDEAFGAGFSTSSRVVA